jgi:hypothetical protein
MSASQDEALKRMSKLVNSLMARPDASPFCEPVDWRGLELFDYPKVIKKMMDLGTVKRKLERKQYATAHECSEDIRLIWTNCMTYNADGSDFWLLAKSFSRRFEDRYKKIKAEYDVGDESVAASPANSDKGSATSSRLSGPPNLDAKAQLASNIFLLSGLELAHVITTIENYCPQALEPTGGAHVEINVDALDPRTFSELEKFTRDKVSSRHSNMELATEDGGKTGGSSSGRKRKKKPADGGTV